MSRIERTLLPGVGVRFDFVTEEGMRVGVVHHKIGRRDVFVCSADDPDLAALTLHLSDSEIRDLVDILGGSEVVQNVAHLTQQIEGLAIDWLVVDTDGPYAGKKIGDARIRTRTGVSVVAVLRGDMAFPAPGPDFLMEPGDTLVVVGTAEGIETATKILRVG